MTFMTLSQGIKEELCGKTPSEIEALNLDDCKSSTIEGLSDEFTNLELLSLCGVGLEDLSGFPKLPSLQILQLSKNSISGGLEALINCPNLQQLNLSANKIASVDALIPLAKLSCLRSLDLLDCEVTNLDNYRKTVFAALPNLKFLDGLDENGNLEPSAELLNGEADDANGDEKAADDNEPDSDDDEEEEEEEYGIEALQRSDELEDDDEDYAPGEQEDAELSEYDEDDDEEEDEEEEDDVEDDGANLSGAGVTGPRRPGSKRRRSDAAQVAPSGVDDGAPAIKHKATGETESPMKNGATVE